MNKLLLIQKPELFQGEKQITKSDYFEGWYFKHCNNNYGISFIPGIHIKNEVKSAFIQVITNTNSYYLPFDFSQFEYQYSPFSIKIGNNTFSQNEIKIEIDDKEKNLYIHGEISYSNSINICKSVSSPNIMGPFSYLPFMECNHAILSMKHNLRGTLLMNNQEYNFDNGTGYIEKDWGNSFPSSYLWCQGNNFENKNASFFLSIAQIPLNIFHFRGFICSFILENKEYRFSTYNYSKIKKYAVSDNGFEIILKKNNYYLTIISKNLKGQKLIAPNKGDMITPITETIDGELQIILSKNNLIIFNEKSNNCGIEMVKK